MRTRLHLPCKRRTAARTPSEPLIRGRARPSQHTCTHMHSETQYHKSTSPLTGSMRVRVYGRAVCLSPEHARTPKLHKIRGIAFIAPAVPARLRVCVCHKSMCVSQMGGGEPTTEEPVLIYDGLQFCRSRAPLGGHRHLAGHAVALTKNKQHKIGIKYR